MSASFDDFRDLLDGRLDPAAAARLRARLAEDAELAAEFADWCEVHAFTAAGAAPVPPSTVTFASVVAARRRDRVRRLRPWMAAAAALVLVAAGAAAMSRFAPRQGTVTLHAISLTATAVPVVPPRLPVLLAEYRPVVDGRLAWISSLDEGRAVARATGRPIFLWIYHPSCPVCVEWDRDAFRDETVESQIAQFVPVRVDVEKAGNEVATYLHGGWPYLGAIDADGRVLLEFAGEQTTEQLRGHLATALARHGTPAAALSWSAVNEAARGLARGEEAIGVHDRAAAYREFEAVVRRDPKGVFGAAAQARVDEMEIEAASALREVQRLMEAGDRAGARSLSEAAESFRGTPYGLDLAGVEQELRATGRFPLLVEGGDARRTQ